MLNLKGAFMTDLSQEIKLYETYFCNELEAIINKIIESLVSNDSMSFLGFKKPNIYPMALEISPEILNCYNEFENNFKKDSANLKEAKIKSNDLYERIRSLHPFFNCLSVPKHNLPDSLYTNNIKYNSQIIYSFDSDKKQTLNNILESAHNYIISVETLKNFNDMKQLYDEIEKINAKSKIKKLSIFDLSKKKKITKQLQEQPNYCIFESYLQLLPYKKELLVFRTDVKYFKDENKLSLQDYYDEINTLTHSIDTQKKHIQSALEKTAFNHLKLKLASLFKNHQQYLQYFSNKTLPVFLHNVENHVAHRGHSPIISNIINRALIDFDLTIDAFNFAEENFNVSKSKKPDWKQVNDSVFLSFVDINNPPPNIKVEGKKVFIDVANTPYSYLSSDLQYPEFELALTAQKTYN